MLIGYVVDGIGKRGICLSVCSVAAMTVFQEVADCKSRPMDPPPILHMKTLATIVVVPSPVNHSPHLKRAERFAHQVRAARPVRVCGYIAVLVETRQPHLPLHEAAPQEISPATRGTLQSKQRGVVDMREDLEHNVNGAAIREDGGYRQLRHAERQAP
jgi:hypothetical protein